MKFITFGLEPKEAFFWGVFGQSFAYDPFSALMIVAFSVGWLHVLLLFSVFVFASSRTS